MAPPENPQPSANSNVGQNVPAQARAPAPANVTVSVMDTFIPTIPEANPDNIDRRFKYSTLTKIEGEPDYEQVHIMQEKIFCNSIAIRSIFGGGKHGHLRSISKLRLYHTESGHAWTVASTGGVYPVFRTNATKNDKKK